jgi:hypothetical protein
MLKFLAPLALLAVAAPAFADAPQDKPFSFERDGVRYVATVKTVGDTMIIRGKDDNGASFDLRAKNGRVIGNYGSTPLSYSVER